MLLQNKLSIIFLLIIVFSFSVNAIGITPGKIVLDAIDSRDETINFKILNNEHKDMKVVLYTEGEFKDLVKLKNEEFRMKSIDSEFSSSYTIKLSKEMSKPGSHSAKIIAMDVNENSNGGTSVGFSTAVASLLFVRVPYPNKYVEPDFYMIGENIDQDIKLFVPVTNLGSEKVDSAKASVTIFDIDNNKIASINTESKSLDKMEKRELVGLWHSNVKPGKYYAVVKVDYDGKSAEISKKFDLGYLILDLVGVSVKDFKLGSIAKFNIVVENKVNYPIDDAYAEMKIFDASGDSVADIKSPVSVLAPGKKSSLLAFWDTENVKGGRFSSDLNIYSKDKELQRRLDLLVKDNAIDINIVGYVIKSSGSSSSTKLVKPVALVTIIIIILVVFNFVYLYLRKRNNNSKGFAYKPNKPSNISNDEIKNPEKQIDIPDKKDNLTDSKVSNNNLEKIDSDKLV